MIIPVTKKIMIIPDFGVSAEAGDILALKEAIEWDKDFSVKITDLRQEIQGEGLKDSRIIEACARKLEELAQGKEPEKKNVRKVQHGRLTITVYQTENDEDESAPDLMVVFGKSAMLAGGVRDKTKILFINPKYDSEWPWKKQYYADRDAAVEFMSRFMDVIREPVDTYVYDGVEVNRRNRPITRFALRTDGKNIGEFSDRYPLLYMKDASIANNPEKLAEAIREFADDRMEFPQFDVEDLTPKKRILIVPDYFVPYNAPHIVELREQLRRRGYYVTVVACSDTLEKTRTGIERRCKKKPFVLIVTIEGGCLLAARITNAPRIFVNPNWDDWEWMKIHLGDEKELVETRGVDNSGPFYTYRINANEVLEARKMSERSYIRRDGKLAVGWFTHDAMDTHLPEEHLKRFNSAAYPPVMDLSTEEGIASLAKEVNKFIENYDD